MTAISIIKLLGLGAGLMLTAQFSALWLAYIVGKYIKPLWRGGKLDDSRVRRAARKGRK